MLGWARGGRSASVNDKLAGEEAAAEETHASTATAGSSSSNLVMDDEDDTMVPLLDVGSDRRRPSGRRWQAERRVQEREERGGSVHEEAKMERGLLLLDDA
jgi:hypothetical protein